MHTDPSAAVFSPQRLERMTSHLSDNFVSPGKISGCQVMVSRRGIPAYFRSFGLADVERNTPITSDTIFRLYSMTKPITSVALMMLWEEGRFQLTDPVYKFIPSWAHQRVWVQGSGAAMQSRPVESPVTVLQLLTHTAGLTYGGLLPGLEHPVDEVYRELGLGRGAGEVLMDFADKMGQVPLIYDPGSRWCYSLATDVCGALVEIISGQSFSDFLRERLFEPLNMVDTDFSVPDDKAGRFAACYSRGADKSLTLEDDPTTSHYRHRRNFYSGGGGLVGTATDYAAFCEMLRQGGSFNGQCLIGRRTLQLMTRNFLGGRSLAQMALGAFSETANEGVGFGLGFASTLDEVASATVGAGDFYWGGRASTLFWVDPIEQCYAIFMTQLIPSSTFNFRGQLKNIIYAALID